MTVWKLRSIDEAHPPIATRLDGDNLRAAIELSDLCLHLHPVDPPRGIRRFGSVEEAHEHRRSWEAQRATA